VLKPQFRGRLTLAARDPRAAPVIDVNLPADPDDDATMLGGAYFGFASGDL
jgi:hypothetical protein